MNKTIIIAVLAVLIGGCAQTTVKFPDGTELSRTRFLHDEQIGDVSYDATDGSFTMGGYVGEQANFLKALQAIIR